MREASIIPAHLFLAFTAGLISRAVSDRGGMFPASLGGAFQEASDWTTKFRPASRGRDHAYVYLLKQLCEVLCLCTRFLYHLAYCFSPTAGLVLHSVLIIAWNCRFPQSPMGVNRSLSRRGGWLIDCETLDIWWLCVGMQPVRKCSGLGSWPLPGL